MAKGDKPEFNVRVRQEPDSEYMSTIGAAWPFKEGKGYVVKLHSVPINWDGSFVLVPRKEDSED